MESAPGSRLSECWLEQAGFSNLQFCPMRLFKENSFVRGY